MYSILCVEIAPASFIMAALYIFRYNLQFLNNVINKLRLMTLADFSCSVLII